ncbi:MAG: T9SS type A sorting domain-containing protein [Bacteroidetes bacterium]|nr:T9SS type A sorting domain-containing protein [Bacteroidota bacterium]
MKKYLLINAVLFLFYVQAIAQEIKHCAAVEKIALLHDASTSETNYKSIYKTNSAQKVAKRILLVPVVVHVLYRTPAQNISDDLIHLQLSILNRDFRRTNTDTSETPAAFKSIAADCEIEFCLAKQDPNGNATNGIIRKETSLNEIGNSDKFFQSGMGGDDIWDRNSYLNIWVCEIQTNGGLLGFSTVPIYNPLRDRDGVVIDYRYFGRSSNIHFNKGRTCTHEVGHWFDLFHIWGDDGGLCIGSDSIADTPNQTTEHSGKPAFPNLDSCSYEFPGTMYMNYMDYTDDGSMNLFTEGQKQRMWTAIETTFRDSLKISKGCIPTSSEGNEILVYPNPSSSGFKIYFYLNSPATYTLTVHDMLGRIIQQHTLENVQVTTELLDLAAYANGVYILQIDSADKQLVKKLIKN